MKYTNKFIFLTLMIVLITSMLIGMTVLLSAKKILQHEIQNSQIILAKQTMRNIDHLLNDAYLDILSISYDSRFTDQFATEPHTAQARKIFTKTLKEKFLFTGPWSELFLTDPQGNLMTSTHRPLNAELIKNRPSLSLAHQQALLGKPYYSDLMMTALGRPGVIFAAPIKKPGTVNIHAVVIGVLEWHAVLKILKQTQLPNEARLYNQKMELIGSSFKHHHDKNTIHDTEILTHIQMSFNKNKTISGSFIRDNNHQVGAYALQQGIMHYKGNHWILLIGMHQKLAFAAVNTLMLKITLLIFCEILLLIGVFYVIGKKFTRPIQDLIETMKIVSDGNLHIKAREFNNNDSEIGHLVNTFNQMTESLNKITISKNAMDNILRSMNDTFMVINLNAKINMLNHTTLILLDYQEEQLVGQSIFTIIEADEALKSLLALLQNKGADTFVEKDIVYNKELPYLARDGRKITMHCSGSLIRSRTGIIQGMVFVGHDLTERITYELKLKQAKEDADVANAAKSNFLATMSHEIRTPMNGVLGNTELMLATKLDAKQRRYADMIYNSGESLLSLIDDILDFSKIEAKKLNLDYVAFNIPKIISYAVAELQHKMIKKGITITVEVAKELPESVIGDPLRLRQVITNLLSNAVKFTKNGTININIEIISNTDKFIALHFEVKDTGIGISQEQKALIFDQFTQADNSTSRRYGGTGLGLAISKRLVEMMGGTIDVKSQISKGSTFYFKLRFEKCLKHNNVNITKPLQVKLDFSKYRVLIAEDDLVNQAVISEMLNTIGCQADIVSNGQEALDTDSSYDIIFMDLEMPEINGYEATRQIRQQEKGNIHKPIIALTAHAVKGVKDQCLAAGMDDHLSKPVSIKTLREKLEKWLG